MAEDRSRKTSGRNRGLALKCDHILTSLQTFLQKEFSAAKAIVLQRGGDINVDYMRLALAPMTICSVSTFCLWPAIANTHGGDVHFPTTRLVLNGNSKFNLGFSWMEPSAVILGAKYATAPVGELMKLLEN